MAVKTFCWGVAASEDQSAHSHMLHVFTWRALPFTPVSACIVISTT
jgi:hypothetical protein